MKTIAFKNKVIKLYDSIDEMPIINFQKYNKYLLIDSGIGSDIDDIDSHIVKIAKLIQSGDKDKAIRELQNMRQNMFMVNSEISPKNMAFAALIYSINGEALTDLSDDNLKKILFSLNQIKQSKLVEVLLWLKKKVASELEVYFPKDFISVKEKEAYDRLRNRTLLVLDEVINDSDNGEQIKKIDGQFLESYKPKSFTGSDSMEIKYDKQFENTCLLISKETGLDAKKMTVLQFYNALDTIKKQAEAKSKSMKSHKF